ncbi:MAG: hypothetical protein NTX22_07055 [Ignavibacteriales bacterium]|nr:hypothetical protein [Ignavibacteriales bacterium]
MTGMKFFRDYTQTNLFEQSDSTFYTYKHKTAKEIFNIELNSIFYYSSGNVHTLSEITLLDYQSVIMMEMKFNSLFILIIEMNKYIEEIF